MTMLFRPRGIMADIPDRPGMVTVTPAGRRKQRVTVVIRSRLKTLRRPCMVDTVPKK